jgi:hypothetical protein
MVDGKVVIGAIGCPNLPIDPAKPDGEKGLLVSAVAGQGAISVSVTYTKTEIITDWSPSDPFPPLRTPKRSA